MRPLNCLLSANITHSRFSAGGCWGGAISLLGRGNLPKYVGAIETRMRFARAFKQLLNPSLLVAYNKTRSKRPLAILLCSQTAPWPSDNIRE